MVGVSTTALSVRLPSPSLALFLAGGMLGGAGAGLLFRGGLSTIVAIASDERRAESLAGFFLAGYLGLAAPVIALGIADADARRARRAARLRGRRAAGDRLRSATAAARGGRPDSWLDVLSSMLDHLSSMQESLELPLNHRIGLQVRRLRSERALTLDAMATRCAVSRSMISLIERGESSPTAVDAGADRHRPWRPARLALRGTPGAATCLSPGATSSRRGGTPSPATSAATSLRTVRHPRSVSSRCRFRRGHGRLRHRHPRAAHRSAGVGARGLDRGHRGRDDAPAVRGGLPGHAARSPDHVPQRHSRDDARYAVVLVSDHARRR